jgi:hypothetical protein
MGSNTLTYLSNLKGYEICDLWFQWMVLSLRFSSWDSSKGELSFPWNLLLYGYKTIIPSPAGDSVLLLGPVTRLVSKLSREDRTIGLSLHHLQSQLSRGVLGQDA